MKKGFTVVEILIVLAILGILAAIIVPAIQKSSQSRDDSFKANTFKEVENVVMVSYKYFTAKVESSQKIPGTNMFRIICVFENGKDKNKIVIAGFSPVNFNKDDQVMVVEVNHRDESDAMEGTRALFIVPKEKEKIEEYK
jgi:prepilin-type N-terminal cleavage/methylation domain-containing protein